MVSQKFCTSLSLEKGEQLLLLKGEQKGQIGGTVSSWKFLTVASNHILNGCYGNFKYDGKEVLPKVWLFVIPLHNMNTPLRIAEVGEIVDEYVIEEERKQFAKLMANSRTAMSFLEDYLFTETHYFEKHMDTMGKWRIGSGSGFAYPVDGVVEEDLITADMLVIAVHVDSHKFDAFTMCKSSLWNCTNHLWSVLLDTTKLYTLYNCGIEHGTDIPTYLGTIPTTRMAKYLEKFLNYRGIAKKGFPF